MLNSVYLEVAVSNVVAVAASPEAQTSTDEEESHPCRWSGCDTSATSLDQLIVHIKEAHIGSGKVCLSYQM